MLKATQLVGFGARTAVAAGAADAVVSYISGTEATTDNQTVYTFTDHAIGTAAADRLVVVVTGAEEASLAHAPTACTIGGNAADLVVVSDGANREGSGIFSLVVATGTTATIVVTFSATVDRGRIEVYTITGYASSTAHDTDRVSATAASISLTLDVPENGVAIAGIFKATANQAVAWTNADEDSDINVEGGSARMSTAHYNATTAVSGHNITASFTSDLHTAVVASWG
jgi:hypothetical protein